MRKFNFFALCVLVLVSVSCQKEQMTDVSKENNEIVFKLDGEFSAEVTTKTDAVTSLSSFNVNCVTGTAGSNETSVFNAGFSGSSSYTGGKYWPSTNPSYKFYASNSNLTPSSNGPTVSAANTEDVVCAVNLSPAYQESNLLTFNHIFAQIGTCNITGPSDYTVSNLSVKVTPKTGGKYNLFSGNGKTDGTGWSNTNTGSETVIASALNSSANNGLYLVPGSYTLTATYTLSTGDYTETFTKTSTVNIVGGKINNISATLPGGNAQEIVFTVFITPWDDNSVPATFS